MQSPNLELDAQTRPVLRFATAGSVDDGKSTLIGRLLFDSKAILEDQYEAILRASRARGNEGIELALLTDGLRAEREQNITIDVAYRYFETPHRKFIIADTPGHEEYTRNMATGASTVDLAVILVDARQGVLAQSKRHAAVSSMLGIRHFAIAVNKMDLVDFSEDRFLEIVQDFEEATEGLHIENLYFFPISALLGDNIVERSTNMDWYQGPTLLSFLETVRVENPELGPLRVPVQGVIRPHQDYRGLLGTIESGEVHVGDEVQVLPVGRTSRIKSLRTPLGAVDTAYRGQAATIEIEDDIDIGRGAMIVSKEQPPKTISVFKALVFWMNPSELRAGNRYVLAHTTCVLRALVHRVEKKLEVENLHEVATRELRMNEIGWLTLETSQPLFADRYAENHATGSFLLIDPETFVTHGAGIIAEVDDTTSDEDSFKGHLIELRGAGATTVASALAKPLRFAVGPALVLTRDTLGDALHQISETVRDLGLSVIVPSEGSEPIRLVVDNVPVRLNHPAEDVNATIQTILGATEARLHLGEGI